MFLTSKFSSSELSCSSHGKIVSHSVLDVICIPWIHFECFYTSSIMGPLEFCAQGSLRILYLNGEPRTGRRAYCEWFIYSCACLLSHWTSLKKYKLRGKRILVWEQQSMKPSSVPFQARGPVLLHCSYAHEVLLVKKGAMTPNVPALNSGFP